MYFGHLCNFMMSLYVSSEICLWRLWDLSCFQILSMNLSSTQTTVRAANRFGVGFSPGRTHVSGNARGNVSRVVTWLMIGPLVELRLDLFYIEIRIVTLCNLICLEFIVCKCRFCSEFVSLSICVASCTKSCRCPSVCQFGTPPTVFELESSSLRVSLTYPRPKNWWSGFLIWGPVLDLWPKTGPKWP